jgi:FKBP-type peptidyl-prolyl cis-trans isomerase SlyD
MSLLVGDNVVVSMHYRLTDEAGTELDSSRGGEPLNYLHGAGNIIPGLEKALTGKIEGDSLQVNVAPADAYGEVMPELLQVVDRSVFQGVDTVEVGMAFEARGPEGNSQRVVVRDVQGDQVTLDANHPLAGVALQFDVEIVGVRPATDEEIAHGHVH